MDQVFRTIGKFWFPVVCIIAGAIFLAMSGGQSTHFMLGAVGVLLVGVLSLLFLTDLVKRKVALILTFLFAIGSAAFGYFTVDSIDTTIKEMEKKKLVRSQTIQKLKDLRDAQVAYEEVNGTYTENLSELVSFVKNGTVPMIKKIGMVPDSVGTIENAIELGLVTKMPAGMTDEQAKESGLIIRDTLAIPVMDAVFNNEIAQKRRKYPLDVDKLMYAPESGEKWVVKAGMLNAGGVQRPFIEITDPKPIYDGPALAIGSTEESHTNGNWKED